MTKSYVRHAPYLRNHTSLDCYLWCTCVKYNISRYFFIFFKILIFWVVRGVKGQKMVENDNKICLSHLISQEPYIIWLSFIVHMCKMIIYPGVFFIFSKLRFFALLGDKRAKNVPKWQKIMSVMFLISGTTYHMIVIYIAHV